MTRIAVVIAFAALLAAAGCSGQTTTSTAPPPTDTATPPIGYSFHATGHDYLDSYLDDRGAHYDHDNGWL